MGERSLYEESIRKILPKIDTSTLTKVLDRLDSLGFADDFNSRKHVEESDLKPFMKPGHIRILLKNWSAPNPEAGPSSVGAGSVNEYEDEGKLLIRHIEKEKFKHKSQVVKSEGTTEIHQLQMKEEATNKDINLRQLSFGDEYPLKETKVALLVGATGAGKSTLIDAFANHLLGVEFEDNFRFRMTKIETSSTMADSQTKCITAYILYHQATFPDTFPYNLMIVDTPGFGDSKGIEVDKRIGKELKLFFSPTEPGGIGVLHAVGIVVQSSQSRLSCEKKYIFDSILALFGKDISGNIFLLITFTDGPTLPIIAVAKKDDLPYADFFKFNNSSLFFDCSKIGGSDKSNCSNYWSMVAENCQKFLQLVAEATPRRLTQTKEVLTEREKIETRVRDLHEKIDSTLRVSDMWHTTLRNFETAKDDIERTRCIITKIKNLKNNRTTLRKGVYAMNCLKCNMTCHHPCSPANHILSNCKYIDKDIGTCKICPGACAVNEHRLMNERIVLNKNIGDVARSMMNGYEKTKMGSGTDLSKMIKEVEMIDTEVVTIIDDVRRSLDKLNKIALRPDKSISTVEYIDLLINHDERQRGRDWQDRVDHLKAIRERAIMIKDIAEGKGISEPYQKVKTEILQKVNREARGGEIINSVSVMTKKNDSSWHEKKNKMLREIYKSLNMLN